MLLIGPEARCVTETAVALADWLGAAILTTPDGLSLVDGARSCGVFSFGASQHAKRVIERADVVLALSSLGEFACRLGEGLRDHVTIQVTERAREVGRNLTPNVALVAPMTRAVAALSAALKEVCSPRAASWCKHSARSLETRLFGKRQEYIHPSAAIRAIQAALPERVRMCLDVTSGALHAYRELRPRAPHQRVFSSIENSACMGEALLASLGIRLASNLPTLALVGDWCHSIVPPEIHTAVELGLDRYVVLVWANAGGAFIGAGVAQQGIVVPDRSYRWRTPPDFAAVARAYGAEGVVVRDAVSLERELRAGLCGAGPVVIEAKIDPDVPVPAGDRFLTLGETRAEARDDVASSRRLRLPGSET